MFFATTSHIQTKVHFIPRDLNNRAHNNAAMAYSSSLNVRPNMTCSGKCHLADHCPVLIKLGNLNIKHCKVTDVSCT